MTRRREISIRAHALARMEARRRALVVRLAEADAAVLAATRALLSYIEGHEPEPLVSLCVICRRALGDDVEIPTRYGPAHDRCVPPLRWIPATLPVLDNGDGAEEERDRP